MGGRGREGGLVPATEPSRLQSVLRYFESLIPMLHGA